MLGDECQPGLSNLQALLKTTGQPQQAYAKQLAERLPGLSTEAAMGAVAETMALSPVAATALVTAIEMLDDHELLQVAAPVRWPLLTAFNALEGGAIEQEVEDRLCSTGGTSRPNTTCSTG